MTAPPSRPRRDLARAIAVLARAQQDVVWNRQQVANQLHSLLREYHPAALEAFAKWGNGLCRPEARELMKPAPTPARTAILTRTQITAALRRAGRKRGIEFDVERLREAFRTDWARQPELVEDALGKQTLAQLGQLTAACTAADDLAQAVEKAFPQHGGDVTPRRLARRCPAQSVQPDAGPAPPLSQVDRLWGRLCHQGTITPASIAALPQLADIAKTEDAGDWALDLAGAIAGGLLQPHGADEEVARCAATLAELRATAAARLRPGLDGKIYLSRLRAMLAFDGQPLWFEALDDFTDSFVTVACPHCDAPVTIAVGDYGCYSSIRDWNLGDVHQVPLRPAVPDELTGAGRMLHESAVRDGQQRLAWGLRHLFGQAECPGCGSVFGIADEYAAAEAPAPWDFARGHSKDAL